MISLKNEMPDFNSFAIACGEKLRSPDELCSQVAGRLVGIGTVAAGTLTGMTFSSGRAEAQLFTQGADLQAQQNIGQAYLYNPNSLTPSYSPVVSVTIAIPGEATTTSSGIMVAPNRILTTGHGFVRNGVDISSQATVTVNTGANFNTNPGIQLIGSEVKVHPSYSGYNGGYTTVDAAVFTVSQSLNVAPLSAVASLTKNQTATFAGFGRMAEVGGTPVQTGDVWGWNSRISQATNTNVDGALYKMAIFDGSGDIPRAGNGLNLSSGGLVVDPVSGLPAGMIVFGSGGTSSFETTGILRFDNPQVYSFATQPVPEPGLIGVPAVIGLLAIRKIRNMFSERRN